MSSLSAKDRLSLCSFTFSDGRRCRTPRIGSHPHFCFYHAQKESRARAAETLGKDLAYFFSGDYLSACDLSTALARLIPAVVRGDVKPRTARTVAYLAQTLLQSIHISQHEYINAFGTNGWRNSICNSVNGNRDYLFPPDPEPAQLPDRAPHVVAGLQTGAGQAPQPAPPPTQAQQPAPSPRTPMPHTSAEFVQHVVAGLQTGQRSSPPAPQPSTTPPQACSPDNPPAVPKPQPAPHPAESPVNCHSEPARRSGRREESAFSSSPAASTTDRAHPIPATQPTPSVARTTQPNNPSRTGPSTPQPARNRDAQALHFDHSCRLLVDGKPF